ncbi:hypothetical protein V5P93_003748 [Actinokineospora auranticolor]|uniref:Excalibur calcium-binding domain-containing protein n=1 Tax=Actinokineospora auranticolor TaxID=155976 RepID=A0A2S6GJD3_9PSEU|nr:hypothetical protein [Actinokineospora auranticolor]PPK65310.1 hypothetical protein CLV40_115157 [Actinokineospora auranticolor]
MPDLTMLVAEVAVTVTGEEHHQPALRRYDVAPGRQRRVRVELAWSVIQAGKRRGERAIEVRLDGSRVGGLTAAMSRRYGPLIDEITARGGVPGCRAVIQREDARGLQISLRLPRRSDDERPSPQVPPVGGAGSAPTSRLHPPAEPAVAGEPTRVVPVEPAVVPIEVAAAPKRSKRPLGIAAAVVGAVFVIAVATNNDDAKNTAAETTRTPATTTTTTTTTTTSTTTTTTTTTATVAPAAPLLTTELPAAPTTVAPAQPAQKPATKTTQPAPHTTTRPPAPKPVTTTTAASTCNPNYSGCVPIASDVDCAGGSGNGPAYVSGPIRVIGSDVYGLDNDKDGIACE